MIKILKENKEYIGIILFSVLTVLFIVPMNFLISNYSELDINFNLALCKLALTTTVGLLVTIGFIIIPFIKTLIKKIWAALLFLIGVFVYFEYLFIMPNIGQLNGEPYDVKKYIHLIAFEILFVIILVSLVIKFFRKEKFISWLYKISIFLILLQGIFLLSQSFSIINSTKEKPELGIYSYKYYNFDLSKYNVYSKNKNIAIILMDGFGKGIFEELLTKYPEYREIFKDFEFYPNTVSYHAQTSFAIHALFTRRDIDDATHNEQYYKNLKNDFSADDALLKVLKENGYTNYLYPFLSNMMYLNPSFVDNLVSTKHGSKLSNKFYRRLSRNTICFYALPVIAKKSAHKYLTKLTLDKSAALPVERYFFEDDFYKKFKDKMSTDNEEKVFKFYHLRGLHEPYKLDENFEIADIANGAKDPVELTAKLYMTMIKNYLDRLKEEGIYDKTAIVFMSDHGSGRILSPLQSEKETNVNSLLLYKNFNQTQDEMKTVDNVYLGIEDISDLVFYSAGINKEKLNVEYEEKFKSVLDKYRASQKVRLETYKMKKEKFSHKTEVVEPSKIFTYISVNKKATMTLSYIKGIRNNKKYIILENENNQFVENVSNELGEFENETGKYVLTTMNFNAELVPDGKYNLKFVWNDKGKYYEMPIGELSIKANELKLLTPLFRG